MFWKSIDKEYLWDKKGLAGLNIAKLVETGLKGINGAKYGNKEKHHMAILSIHT